MRVQSFIRSLALTLSVAMLIYIMIMNLNPSDAPSSTSNDQQSEMDHDFEAQALELAPESPESFHEHIPEAEEELSTTEPPKEVVKRILIGFFSVARDIERRAVIRSILHDRSDESIDVVFVIGQSEAPFDKEIANSEHKLHGDLFFVPCKENMEEGKTFTYFKTVYERQQSNIIPKYDYVMKADQDSFIHPANLLMRLLELPRDSVYTGCMVHSHGVDYATGMAYIVSWDLVTKIAQSKYASENIVGFEDVQMGKWLDHFKGDGYPVRYINDWDRFRDKPGTKSPFGREFYPGAIAVHWHKTIDELMETAVHFYPDIKSDGG